MRIPVLCFAFLAMTGCATAPPVEERPLVNGTEIARAVALCRTTATQLQAQLGPPSRDGVLGRARVMTWIVEWDPLVKYLGVLLDEHGTVVDVYWNLPSEIQWSPVNRCP